MNQTPRLAAISFAFLLTAGTAAAAQQPARPPAPSAVTPQAAAPAASQVVSDDDAERTRERLRAIFRQYPPSLADVLRLDPSLLSSDSYLAPYPELAAFLKQHPNITHNPAYFVGTSRAEWNQPQYGAGRE